MERGTQNGLAQVGVALPQAAFETVGPGAEPSGVGNKLALILLVGNNLSQLDLDVLRLGGLAAEARQGVGGPVKTTTLDIVTRGVGQKQQTTAKDGAPNKLETDGNAVGASVAKVFGAVDDARGEEETDRNAELVAGN